jgi:hypothetical protein
MKWKLPPAGDAGDENVVTDEPSEASDEEND